MMAQVMDMAAVVGLGNGDDAGDGSGGGDSREQRIQRWGSSRQRRRRPGLVDDNAAGDGSDSDGDSRGRGPTVAGLSCGKGGVVATGGTCGGTTNFKFF